MPSLKSLVRSRGLLLSLLTLLLLANTACFTVDVLLSVKPDGSGTVKNEFTVKNAFLQQMQAMAASFTEDGETPESPDLFSEESLREMGESMGPGVTLVETERLEGEDFEGARATYAFTDITQVQTSTTPGPPGSGGGDRADDEKLRFTLERAGGKSVLTLIPPEPVGGWGSKDDTENAEAEEPEAEKTPEEQAQADAALGMMKQFFQGFRIRMRVVPEGKVLSTNARFVDDQGVITLMELDFDQLLAAPGVLESLMQGGDPGSPAELQRMLEGIPGIKMQLDEPVRIEFR